jgi:hypothetical protein
MNPEGAESIDNKTDDVTIVRLLFGILVIPKCQQ